MGFQLYSACRIHTKFTKLRKRDSVCTLFSNELLFSKLIISGMREKEGGNVVVNKRNNGNTLPTQIHTKKNVLKEM